MGNLGGRNRNVGYNDPNFYPYGTGYGNRAPTGLAGYGGPDYINTPGAFVEQPWQTTLWTEYYVPTVGGRQKRPVIYIAAPLPAAAPANPCAGIGGFGGGFGGGFPSMGAGFGTALPPMGGGFGTAFPPMGGGFGAGLPPMGGGFGAGLPPMGGGFGAGANLGYQVLPMMTVAYGGGIPGVGGGISPFGGGLPLF